MRWKTMSNMVQRCMFVELTWMASSNYLFSFFVDTGDVYCWGHNQHGQCGSVDQKLVSTPYLADTCK